MPMTVVVTTNAPGRFRGFLASCMCEIGPGVYTAPRMTKAVRERVWDVLLGWQTLAPGCTVIMTWPDNAQPGGQAIATFGLPATQIQDYNGIYLSRRALPKTESPPVPREST